MWVTRPPRCLDLRLDTWNDWSVPALGTQMRRTGMKTWAIAAVLLVAAATAGAEG